MVKKEGNRINRTVTVKPFCNVERANGNSSRHPRKTQSNGMPLFLVSTEEIVADSKSTSNCAA